MDEKEAIRLVDLAVCKVSLRPGELLIFKCPESWTPRQIAMYDEYFNAALKDILPGGKAIFVPCGMEVTSTSQEG